LEKENPLVNKDYLLQKFAGKGGWTYAIISEISIDKRSRFGWVKVKGRIDSFELKNYKLMPLGNGKLFLPVKAEIRKKTGKKDGDWVRVVLYPDDAPTEIPGELLSCLEDDSVAYEAFKSYTDGQRKEFIDWIYSAKTEETRVNRIVETLDKLAKGRKFRDKL
jgi:hypothetical protein